MPAAQNKKNSNTNRRKSNNNKNTNRTNRKNTKDVNNSANPLVSEIIFILLLVFSILVLLSLFGLCGYFGEVVANVMFGIFGLLAYIFPVYIIVCAGFYISNRGNKVIRNKIIYSIGLYFGLLGMFQWFSNTRASSILDIYKVSSHGRSGGGFLGGILGYALPKFLGRGGSFVIILGIILIFLVLVTRKLFFASIHDKIDEKKKYIDYEDETYDAPNRTRRTNRPVKKESKPISKSAKLEEIKIVNKDNETVAASKAMDNNSLSDLSDIDNNRDIDNIRINRQPISPLIKDSKNKEPMTNEIGSNSFTDEELVDESLVLASDLDEKDDLLVKDVDNNEDENAIFNNELISKFGKKSSVSNNSERFADDSSDMKVPNPPSKELTDDELLGLSESDTPKKVVITKEDEKEMEKVKSDLSTATVKRIPYKKPSLDLLEKPNGKGDSLSDNELKNTALKLQNTLQSFGVGVKMGDVSVGPSVTRYELIPEQGVKVNKITSLSDDIKLSLAASDIRIEAPIPGKSAVGIEVPNQSRTTVTLRELLESKEFTKAKSKVTFAVGKDIAGKTIVTDIAKMPHLLVAGATGSGKSVLINTIIMSIIYKANPNDVKLIMVDPKMVELTAYEGIPHLMIPVVKDPKKASAALSWAVAEMTTRYQKFADASVRDIKSYNEKISKLTNKNDPEYQKLPQVVIIVDEFADLMMVAPGEVEDAVCRLAQLARAAGIHLVLATQRPSVNVITGTIKANIPSRIALSVSSQIDSRTIIDKAGAEKLLGNGDMLFNPQNLPEPIRVQGAFVSDAERDRVVSFLKNNSAGPAYNEDVSKQIETAPVPGAKNTGTAAISSGDGKDELFVEAAKIIIEKDKASIGLLQRMLRIGFNRAARIMDQLGDAGVVGPEEGTKARKILMSMEQFENYLEENGWHECC